MAAASVRGEEIQQTFRECTYESMLPKAGTRFVQFWPTMLMKPELFGTLSDDFKVTFQFAFFAMVLLEIEQFFV